MKVLLYSGGMDSWLIDRLWKPDKRIYVDMKTKYSEEELENINKNISADVDIIQFPLGQWEREDAIIPLRNLYLILAACNTTGYEDIEICVGATYGDRSLDQSEEFFNKAEDILNYLYRPQSWIPNGRKIKLITKYKHYTKAELLRMFIEEGGDIEEAFQTSLSCYNPDEHGNECWSCKPCFRKFVAFAYNDYPFTEDVIKKNITYIKETIVPEMERGVYRGEKEDHEINTVLEKYREV